MDASADVCVISVFVEIVAQEANIRITRQNTPRGLNSQPSSQLRDYPQKTPQPRPGKSAASLGFPAGEPPPGRRPSTAPAPHGFQSRTIHASPNGAIFYTTFMSVFTEIIAGNIPGRFAYADDVCVVFTTIEPIAHGHMLVVPREEVSRFTDLSEEVFAHLSVVAQRIGRAGERAFDAPRAMVMIAGMEVPHVHIHVIPARSERDIQFVNAMRDVPGAELDDDVARIREALRDLGFGEYVPGDLHRLD